MAPPSPPRSRRSGSGSCWCPPARGGGKPERPPPGLFSATRPGGVSPWRPSPDTEGPTKKKKKKKKKQKKKTKKKKQRHTTPVATMAPERGQGRAHIPSQRSPVPASRQDDQRERLAGWPLPRPREAGVRQGVSRKIPWHAPPSCQRASNTAARQDPGNPDDAEDLRPSPPPRRSPGCSRGMMKYSPPPPTNQQGPGGRPPPVPQGRSVASLHRASTSTTPSPSRRAAGKVQGGPPLRISKLPRHTHVHDTTPPERGRRGVLGNPRERQQPLHPQEAIAPGCRPGDTFRAGQRQTVLRGPMRGAVSDYPGRRLGSTGRVRKGSRFTSRPTDEGGPGPP